MMRTLVASLAVLGLMGCAGVQIPPERLEQTEANIRGAEEVGAVDVPNAKLHLQLAKEEVVAAKKLAANGDERAVLVLARADADAGLALALAREAAMRAEALQAAEDLKTVQARGTP